MSNNDQGGWGQPPSQGSTSQPQQPGQAGPAPSSGGGWGQPPSPGSPAQGQGGWGQPPSPGSPAQGQGGWGSSPAPQQPQQPQPAGWGAQSGPSNPQQPQGAGGWAPPPGGGGGAAGGGWTPPPARGTKTSGLAIASLICGFLGCCGGFTAVLGVIFGVVALIAIGRRDDLTGTGLAIGGIITSIITMGIVAACFAFVSSGYRNTKEVCSEVIEDITNGDYASARDRFVPAYSNNPTAFAEMQRIDRAVEGYGEFEGLENDWDFDSTNGQFTYRFIANFANDEIPVSCVSEKFSSGWKLVRFDFQM